MQNIKVKFNATSVTFNIYEREGEEVKITTETALINQKRQLPYIQKYLNKHYPKALTIEVLDYEYVPMVASLPFSTVLEYSQGVSS
nr:MAG TPA: hypothetical protein [Caudoviricetes sp.]